MVLRGGVEPPSKPYKDSALTVVLTELAKVRGLEPLRTVLETVMLPITSNPRVAVDTGVEPIPTESKSVVLPLHQSTI